ncbi:DUF4142 domain-containing protein [Sphingobacterium athyrii]|uniref:DUF4142 domain-containing protein n=1 Tax=Sphingobacterium athyrii TaxID=2152717 RepID=A0A363NUA0_9SPHI|nr:DUF4142 domain-containing protein [Sphingobacterium athyrii]PUV24288.1 hypothetical protein DCO56_13105 [Sphingobacterium athyrii]
MKIILRIVGLCIAIMTWTMVIYAQDTSQTQAQTGDIDFASKATASNNFEIQAANIALTKSQDQNIKQYAQMIVDDHTAAGNELATLVKNKNWQLSTPDNQNYTQLIDQLNNADPANFDRTYVDLMAKSHQDAITLFKDASTGTATTDAELRKFATDKIPAFQKHLDQLKTMQPAADTTTKDTLKNTSPGAPSPTKLKPVRPSLK